MRVSLDKMSNCVVLLMSGLVLAVSSVNGDRPDQDHFKSSVVHPRSIKNFQGDRGGGGGGGGTLLGIGSPAEWTMSKANLVAEFFTSEPAQNRDRADRSQKNIFSFLTGNLNNGSNNKNTYVPSHHQLRAAAPHRLPQGFDKSDKNGNPNLIASGTTYSQQTVPFDISRNNINVPPGGFASPFRPINHPQQNIISLGSPASGYPHNVRPPRGPPPPPPPPSRQFVWDPRQINGLRPPPVAPSQQQQHQPPPPPLYLPPQHAQLPRPQPQSQGPPSPPFQAPNPQPPPQNQHSQPPPQYPVPGPQNSSSFTPSSQYLPAEHQPAPNSPPQPHFQPGSPPPQILDTYSKQAMYPPPPPGHYSTEKSLVYVMANSSFDKPSSGGSPSNGHSQFNTNSLTSYTQYENESVPPPPVPNSILQQAQNQYQQQSGQQSTQKSNLNALALTEPLSHVLAEANAKAGEAMDKTIRFVIHKPEDEDIVKNAILEDAQNRYEDVKFVQGPTLKVQRKETVYLPPKKKTVVYILLKEPQIDTDVEVMSPQEDEPVPEVYITYQKSDGAVKTKHYSPKPIREEDMKKYLDIEEDSSYASGEESRIHPRFSKSTSVSLSTSSKVSRKTATMSTSLSPSNVNSGDNNASLLANHKLSSPSANETANVADMKSSPLLYTSRNINQIQISNSTSSVRPPQKKPRSSESARVLPSPRRFQRHHPIQCPTVTS